MRKREKAIMRICGIEEMAKNQLNHTSCLFCHCEGGEADCGYRALRHLPFQAADDTLSDIPWIATADKQPRDDKGN